MNISQALRKAVRLLAETGIPEPERESSSLLRFALNRERVFLFSHPEYELTDAEENHFDNILQRRLGREPLQYITGRQEFYGLEFLVTKDVLIPRPETEMLADKAIEILDEKTNPAFAEMGIGSGCISISVLANVPKARAAASDISPRAVGVARANAVRHGVGDRLEIVESDLFANLRPQRFDVIVSNPPYVAAAAIDGLQPEVRDFEPRTALTDGGDGTSVIKRIVDDSPAFLKAGGRLIMEIGFDQAEQVETMFDASIWGRVDILPDFQFIPRMVVAVLR